MLNPMAKYSSGATAATSAGGTQAEKHQRESGPAQDAHGNNERQIRGVQHGRSCVEPEHG